MAVQVKVDFDTKPANKALGDLQNEGADKFKELGKIANEAFAFEKAKEAIGGLKQVVEGLGPILNERQKDFAKTADQVLKFGDSGFKIGSVFGPIGGLIGAAIGAIGGYFFAASQKAAELKAKLQEVKEAGEASRAKLAELDTITMGNVVAEIDKVRASLFKGGKEAETAREIVKGLLNEGATSLAEAFDKAAANADKTKSAVEAIVKPVKMTAEEASAAIQAQADNIKVAKKQIQEESQKIKDAIAGGYSSEAILKAQEKLLKQLNENLAGYTKNEVDAAQALRKALDDEAKDAEEAAKKKIEAQKAYSEKRDKMLDEDSKKLSLITQNAIDDLQKEQDAKDAARQADEDWALAVQKAEVQKQQAAIRGVDAVRAARVKAAADDAALLEKQKQEALAAYQEMAASIKGALQPLGDITSAVFGKIQSNIEAGNKAFAGVGLAAKGAIAEVLKNFAKQWGAQALSEVAAGIASLALGPVGGVSAGMHFAAAAGYGAAAAAAGLGGAVISKNVAAATPAASSAPNSPPSSNSGSPFLGNQNRAGNGGTIIVQMNGNLFMGSGDDRALEEPGRNLGRALAIASAQDKRLAA